MDIKLEGLDRVKAAMQLQMKALKRSQKQAVSSVFQFILRSLRAATKKANPNSAKEEIEVLEETNLKIGYRRDKGSRGKNITRRVITDGIHEITPDLKVFWLTKQYRKHEQYFVYKAKDKVFQEKEFLIVARNLNEAQKSMINLKKQHIKVHAGLAQDAIGLARALLFRQSMPSTNQNNIADLKKQNLVEVNFQEKLGFNTSEFRMLMKDKLDYAEDALKTSMDQIIQNGTNAAVGQLLKRLNLHDIEDIIDVGNLQI